MLYILMKLLSHASVKKKTKRIRGFKFHSSMCRHSSEGVKAVKGVHLDAVGP